MSEKEIRKITTEIELRNANADKETYIEGYALRFDSWSELLGGEFKEKIERTALDQTDMSSVVALYNHNDSQILGRSGINLELEVDQYGLKFKLHPVDTSYAKDLIENMKRGIINKCSFAMSDITDSWNDSETLERTIHKIGKLWDVSIVTTPAYEETTVTIGERSLNKIKNRGDKRKMSNLEIYSKIEAIKEGYRRRTVGQLQREYNEMKSEHRKGLLDDEKREIPVKDELEILRDVLDEKRDDEQRTNSSNAQKLLGDDYMMNETRKQENTLTAENTRTGEEVRLYRPNEKISFMNQNKDHSDFSLGKLVRGLVTGDWTNAEIEQRQVASNSVINGGVVLPAKLSEKVIDMVRSKSAVLQLALTVPMETRKLSIGKQVSDFEAHTKQELEPIQESTIEFDIVDLIAKTFTAMGQTSIEFWEDGIVNDNILNSLAQSIAMELDKQVLLGDGTKENGLDNILGLYNLEGINHETLTEELENYQPINSAIGRVRAKNFDPNAVIVPMSVSTAIDGWTDSTGQPLQPLRSIENLEHFYGVNQLDGDNNFIIVGDFSKLLVGIRTDITVEINRVNETSWKNLGVSFRAYLRADSTTLHDGAFDIIELPAETE